MTIIQGNTYKFPIRINMGGVVLGDKDVKTVEFTFGCVKKRYPKDVTFDGEFFIVPLLQEDTLQLPTMKSSKYQCRVLLNDNSVKGSVPVEFCVVPSESKEVLL